MQPTYGCSLVSVQRRIWLTVWAWYSWIVAVRKGLHVHCRTVIRAASVSCAKFSQLKRHLNKAQEMLSYNFLTKFCSTGTGSKQRQSNTHYLVRDVKKHCLRCSVSNPGFPEPQTRFFRYFLLPETRFFFQPRNPDILISLESLLHSNISNSDNTEVVEWRV